MSIVIELTPDRKKKLEKLGFRPPAGVRVKVAEKSRWEAPSNMSATFHPVYPVSVGAFTLLPSPEIANATIGRYCSIAPGVKIGMAEHPTEFLTSSTVGWQRNFMQWRRSCSVRCTEACPFCRSTAYDNRQ
ncbi:hypothetical protein GCM10007920_25840 [Ciceribacter naphthalenivorans]|uniref:Uncharacterized protein n=2 Tax=Alphaproteobacteria TaxID=28211 RepID=A0A512HHE7_9HYPH|nr:hypothetical protein RNA01_17940 [Ciceribacter naphthalenivorans]GLR22796.1 hypothetical protein GCM10007920_25840 [Ciceribacter naphthalenivorans]GLT05652.1 hypothetical protein GCM10007926_25840 [Sphingomonas psychrolutea]